MPSPATMFQRRSSAPNTAFSATMRMSASKRRLEAGRHGPAVDGRDHRLEHVDLARVAACPGQLVDAAAKLVPLGHRPLGRVGQVPPGAERAARPREHEDERVVVVAKAAPGVMELGVHLSADRVPLLRTIQRQDRDPLGELVSQGLVARTLDLALLDHPAHRAADALLPGRELDARARRAPWSCRPAPARAGSGAGRRPAGAVAGSAWRRLRPWSPSPSRAGPGGSAGPSLGRPPRPPPRASRASARSRR